MVLLDNVEHLTEAAPRVAAFLAAALAGEQEFPVPPLAVPDPAYLAAA